MLNVWGTWCIACREEHEELLAIARQHVVPLIGLDYMDQREKAQAVAHAARQSLPSPSASTPTGARRSTGACTVRPETFLVDGQGRVIYKFISPMTPEVWQHEFLPRIAAARAERARDARAASTARSLLLAALWAVAGAAARRPAAAGAVDVYGEIENPALQARFEHITQDLRCLVCQNESIADSNVELAADLRRQVREMLIAGKSDDAIFQVHDRPLRRFRALQSAADPEDLADLGRALHHAGSWEPSSSSESRVSARACRWTMSPRSEPK